MSLNTPEKVEGVLQLLKSLEFFGVKPTGLKVQNQDMKDDINPEAKHKSSIASTGSSSESQSKDSKEKDEGRERPPPPLYITLQGLQSMHDPSKTSVLYTAPLDPDLRLYRLCTRLREVFKDFLVGEERPLLLHATVVNTVYVKGSGAGRGGGRGLGGRGRGGGRGGRGGGRRKERLVLDARELLTEWEDFVWMKDVRVERLAVLRMGAKVGDSGEEEYEVEGEIDMPK